MSTYIALIFDVGEREVEAASIAEAAAKFVAVWGDDAVLEVHRADYRGLGA